MSELSENVSRQKSESPRILVVDDDQHILKLINKFLSLENYTVNFAHNGQEAIRFIDRFPDTELVILDMIMPDITGLNVCRIFREKYSLFELPIIFLTARNSSTDIVNAFEAGANDYLSKPFNRPELLARVKTLVKLKRLTKSNVVLQEAMDLKNQFLHMTIHDLRNPLNVVIGLTSMIKREANHDDETNEYLDLILESSDLMLSLVNELLDAARIDSGKMVLKKTIENMSDLARLAYDKNLNSAEKKGQELVLELPPENDCFISCDLVRMKEIMDNLVSNAIKYSPLGKKIWLRVSKQNDNNLKKYVRFSIKDEGPGLSEEDKKKIFGRFQRLSAQPTGGESSSGLGLSIVKQLVELHDGRIWVDSEHGRGSEFIVELDAVDNPV